MLTEQTVLSIFAQQLNGWTKKELEDAVRRNVSLSYEISTYRSRDLQVWRGLASSYRLLNRREYDRVVHGINYHSVLRKVREVNPQLAYAVETTHGADGWLLSQIRDVKSLIVD